MGLKEFIKEKIEPHFPFYTYKEKDGIGVRIKTPKGQYLVYYKDKDGNKKNLKVSFDESEESMNLFEYIKKEIEEVEGNSDFEQKKIIQVSDKMPEGDEDGK